jgi:hypothetical protein
MIEFRLFCELATIEAIYQQFAAAFLTRRIFLSRQEFASRPFLIAVGVDQMLAVTRAGFPLNVVMIDAAPANGGVARRG